MYQPEAHRFLKHVRFFCSSLVTHSNNKTLFVNGDVSYTIDWLDATQFDSEDDYTAQVVETSATASNQPYSRDNVHPDEHIYSTYL